MEDFIEQGLVNKQERIYTSLIRLLRRYRHLNWAMLDQALVSGVNFLTGILIARYLGAEEFGRFTLVWIGVLLLNSFQFSLIVAPMLSIGPKKPEHELPGYYGAVCLQQVGFALFSFVALAGGVYASHRVFPEWNLQRLGFSLASAGAAFQVQDFLRRYFFATNRPVHGLINDAISYVGQLFALFCFFRVTTIDSGAVLWIMAISSGIAIGAGCGLLKALTWQKDVFYKVLRQHWHFSKWLVASTIIIWIKRNIFLMAAGGMVGVSAVGTLKACQTVFGATHPLLKGLENVVPPRAAHHLHHGGASALKIYLWRTAGALGTCMAGVSLMIAIAPKFWLRLFYGPAYAGHSHLLRLIAMSYVMVSLNFVLGIGLRTCEQTRSLFRARVWSLFGGLLVVFPFVKTFGIEGMAIGTLCMQSVRMALLFRKLRSTLDKRPFGMHGREMNA